MNKLVAIALTLKEKVEKKLKEKKNVEETDARRRLFAIFDGFNN